MVSDWHVYAVMLAGEFFGAWILSYLGVAGLRRWAERKQVLDIPNERSSHTQPTPRGGGLAIVVVTLAGVWLTSALWPVAPPTWDLVAYTAGAILIAWVSWLDDIHTLPNQVRFGAHCLAALVAIAVFGAWPVIQLPGLGEVTLGWLGVPVAFLWIVGLTNAYNFMDGIDGLAGGQAVVAGAGWVVLGGLNGQWLVAALGLLLAASSLGFLGHNWPPARIFMGDVSSAFLGYTFAVLALWVGHANPAMPAAGGLLLWPFIFDAVFTFLRRLRKRENVFQAHRSHLYQRLVIAGRTHRWVAALYLGLAGVGVGCAWAWVWKVPGVDVWGTGALLVAALGLWRGTVWCEQHKATEPGLGLR